MKWLVEFKFVEASLSDYQQPAQETAVGKTEPTILRVEDLLDWGRADRGNFHFLTREVDRRNQLIELTAKEFDVL